MPKPKPKPSPYDALSPFEKAVLQYLWQITRNTDPTLPDSEKGGRPPRLPSMISCPQSLIEAYAPPKPPLRKRKPTKKRAGGAKCR